MAYLIKSCKFLYGLVQGLNLPGFVVTTAHGEWVIAKASEQEYYVQDDGETWVLVRREKTDKGFVVNFDLPTITIPKDWK